MRYAGKFHPEWGTFAPAPSFIRTVRIALIATAIGAIGGGVVVNTLLERPVSRDDKVSIPARVLVVSEPVVAAPPEVPASSSAEIVPATEAVAAPAHDPVKAAPVKAAPVKVAPKAAPRKKSVRTHRLAAFDAGKRQRQPRDERLLDEYGREEFCCAWRSGQFDSAHDGW